MTALVSISPAAATVPLPVGTITVPTSGNFLYLNSEPGDFVGQGLEQLYTSPESSFAASPPDTATPSSRRSWGPGRTSGASV